MVGAMIAGPQVVANAGVASFARIDLAAELPDTAVNVATTRPQGNAAATNGVGSRSKKSTLRATITNGTAYRTNSTAAVVVAIGKCANAVDAIAMTRHVPTASSATSSQNAGRRS